MKWKTPDAGSPALAGHPCLKILTAPSKSYRLILSVLGISACGGGAGPDVAEVDDFLKAAAAASCDWEFRCCKDAEIPQRSKKRYTDRVSCQPFKELELKSSLYVSRLGVEQGRRKVDSTQKAACLAQMQMRACKVDIAAMMTTDPCTKVFGGTIAAGDECRVEGDCVSGARCVTSSELGGRGVCVPLQKEGEVCSLDSDCARLADDTRLRCFAQDFRCHRPARLDEVCAYTINPGGQPVLPLLVSCDARPQPILYCDPAAKACKKLPRAGEACLTPALSLGINARCDPDPALKLTCVGNVCRAPGNAGDSCTSASSCAPDLACEFQAGMGTCKALPGEGQPCPNAACAQPLWCNRGVFPAKCEAPARAGDSCATKACDTSLYCDAATRVCAPRGGEGAACNNAAECLSTMCDRALTDGGPSSGFCSAPPALCTGR